MVFSFGNSRYRKGVLVRCPLYFEAKIVDHSDLPKFIGYPLAQMPIRKPHIRIGWACRYMRYDTPIGHNDFSYAFGDDGCIVHAAKRIPYAPLSFGVGDIISCYIKLQEPTWFLPDPRKQAKLHEFVEAGILCDPKHPPSPSINIGSSIEFAINGRRFWNSLFIKI